MTGPLPGRHLVKLTDDGTPCCPHCTQPMVSAGGEAWQCPDAKAINDWIVADLARAFATYEETP